MPCSTSPSSTGPTASGTGSGPTARVPGLSSGDFRLPHASRQGAYELNWVGVGAGAPGFHSDEGVSIFLQQGGNQQVLGFRHVEQDAEHRAEEIVQAGS